MTTDTHSLRTIDCIQIQCETEWMTATRDKFIESDRMRGRDTTLKRSEKINK